MMGMDMGMEGGQTDYSPLYARAKEILAAGMLAELAEDAKEAMGESEDQGEGEDMCPHCGAPMGGPMGNPMAKKMLSPLAPQMPEPGLEQFAMRMPPPAEPMDMGMPPMPGRLPQMGM
jgi:hypothetical protein